MEIIGTASALTRRSTPFQMKRRHVVLKVLRVIWDPLKKEMNFLKDTRQRNVMKSINSIKKPLSEAERQLFSLKGHRASLHIHAAKASDSSKCRIFFFYCVKGICFKILFPFRPSWIWSFLFVLYLTFLSVLSVFHHLLGACSETTSQNCCVPMPKSLWEFEEDKTRRPKC